MIIYFLLLNIVFANEPDSTKVYKLNELKVEDKHTIEANENNLKRTLNSTDDILSRSAQITMQRRANFALEPTIRGLSNDRTSITIDGMHLFGACVDRMDPASNYIEIQNLSGVDVNTPQNCHSGGGINSIDFRTDKIDFSDKFLLNYNSYFGSAAANFINGIKTKYSNSKFSTSTNFIYKSAGDFQSGEQKLIKNSSYGKFNLTNDNYLKLNQNHTIGTSFLADVSYDVGYPALIMDTRKTETFLFAIKHNFIKVGDWVSKSENKIYFNSVFHAMDDYSRSEEEIKNRIVMPNMYMPMLGNSSVLGLLNTYEILTNFHSIKFFNDFYSQFSGASMKMIPLNNPSNVMRLKNIADSRIFNDRFSIKYSNFNIENFELSASSGVNFQYADLTDKQNRDVFLFFSKASSSQNISIAPFVQASISKQISQTKFSLSAAYYQRNPSKMELYSYYVYNPMDNSFYTGNPQLKNESNINVEFGITNRFKNLNSSLNVFNMDFDNYISGVIADDQLQNPNFPQLFRQYKNTGRANIWGIEYIANYSFNQNILIDLSLRYNRAYSISLKDNLPLISPFTANLFFTYIANKFKFVADMNYNAKQEFISKLFYKEDKTNQFIVAGLRMEYQIQRYIQLSVGVENIFDTLYHYHTSINDLPSPGRNFYIKFNYNYL